jgi:hypothetical protein
MMYLRRLLIPPFDGIFTVGATTSQTVIYVNENFNTVANC